MNDVTILPDGSAFGVMSFPLPKDHWLYAPREYEPGAEEPKELPHPILTHAHRAEVVAAVRYAIRGATMCGKEKDFDPDALVQNAVYALCGPFEKTVLPSAAQPPTNGGDPANPRDDSDRSYNKPVGYLPAYELSRLHSGHGAQLRSARFGPSALDGDVPVYLGSSDLALVQALIGAQRAINSMKVEAETAAQGDEQMMLDACEQISNEGLEASLAIQAALSTAAQPPAAPQEELHEYEWALYEMRGHRPSDKDNWHAGGTAPTQAEAEREAAHYLGQYANDDTGFRFEVFEVTRKSLGGLTPNAEVTGRPPHGTETE